MRCTQFSAILRYKRSPNLSQTTRPRDSHQEPTEKWTLLYDNIRLHITNATQWTIMALEWKVLLREMCRLSTADRSLICSIQQRRTVQWFKKVNVIKKKKYWIKTEININYNNLLFKIILQISNECNIVNTIFSTYNTLCSLIMHINDLTWCWPFKCYHVYQNMHRSSHLFR